MCHEDVFLHFLSTGETYLTSIPAQFEKHYIFFISSNVRLNHTTAKI